MSESDVRSADVAATAPAAAAPAATAGDDTTTAAEPNMVDTERGELSVESLLDDLERVAKERDMYLDDMRRVAAEFANYRRQTDKRHAEMIEQAASRLAETLLPVLDACDAALAQGADDVAPVHQTLLATLQKSGLSLMHPLDQSFDPTQHEAVMHEEGEGGEAKVAAVLRTGYMWNGRVLRPALVKVRG